MKIMENYLISDNLSKIKKSLNKFKLFYILSFLLLNPFYSYSQLVKDHTVRINAFYQDTLDKSGIRLIWYDDKNAINYSVLRKLTSDNEFKIIANNIGIQNNYFDTTAKKNQYYEYQVQKIGNYADTASYTVNGYITTTFQSEINSSSLNTFNNKGKLLILVDNTILDSIINDFNSYISTLLLDGWNVIIKTTPRNLTPNSKSATIIKEIIRQENLKQKIDNVLLLGRLPVMYSGDFAIDGHADHRGAWPSDVLYVDLNGIYTDQTRNTISATANRQHNIINDGKYDQNQIQSKIDIGIGRVDFYNLPYFKETEIDLYKRYLNKNINYRNGNYLEKLITENRDYNKAIVNDNFGEEWRSKFAASGFNSFTPLVDRFLLNQYENNDNNDTFLFEGRMREIIREKDYYLAYGCGAGAYTACHDVAYSEEYAITEVKTIFQSVFGSYNGDWDSENNLMRATIASMPSNLICYWGSRPFWNLQFLGIGKDWGYCTKITQSNFDTYQHQTTDGTNGVHISLMGDPSLQMFVVLPPKNCEKNIKLKKYYLNWETPIKMEYNSLEGYVIYKVLKEEYLKNKIELNSINNNFNLKLDQVSDILNKDINEYDLSNEENSEQYFYLIKAIYKINTPSSSFYNLSNGILFNE